MFDVSSSWCFNITVGDVVWTPKKLQHVGDDIFVHIGPYDYGLVTVLIQGMGFKIKYKDRPSLAQTPGYKALCSQRNSHQASEMQSDPTKAARSSRKRLFGGSSPKKKAKRQSAQAMKEKRQAPETFVVALPAIGSFPSSGVTMIRPVKCNDELFVKGDPENVKATLWFIIEHGLAIDMLLSKRGYTKKDAKPDDLDSDDDEQELHEDCER